MTPGSPIVAEWRVPAYPVAPGDGFGIAVDIGTTTVVMALVNRADGSLAAIDSFLNPQKKYGADVISRIKVSTNGHGEKLRAAIAGGLALGAERLCAAVGISPAAIQGCSVSANTAMMHFLLSLPCEGLGIAPFTPAAVSFPDRSAVEVFGASVFSGGECTARFSPAVGAFIGGDITAGIAALELDSSGAPSLFIDLGTNAEIVLAAGGEFLCASAAAGPAFEGGSISCGTGGVRGAVSSVFLSGSRFGYGVIGETESRTGPTAGLPIPSGLCGSAVIDLVALALEAGLIRMDGSLSPVCESSGIVLDPAGGLRLLASDVREIQVAKAAVRAGISVLLETAALREGDVSNVYLAGGFGFYLRESSAIGAGLLPRAFAGKISAVGNTSLAGSVRTLLDPDFSRRVSGIVSRARLVQLADHPLFNDYFIGSMGFD